MDRDVTILAEPTESVETPATPEAYQFEVDFVQRVVRGVCSTAPLDEVVRWMNATSVFTWAPATGLKFTADGTTTPGESMDWPCPCPETGKAETHKHDLLRSGATA